MVVYETDTQCRLPVADPLAMEKAALSTHGAECLAKCPVLAKLVHNRRDLFTRHDLSICQPGLSIPGNA